MGLVCLTFGIFLMIAIVRASIDFARKSAQRKMQRMQMFETIGTAWIVHVNKHISDNPCHRNPFKDIREKSFKEKGSWVIAFPVVRDTDPTDSFELFITISFVDPYSQVSTTLLGLLHTKKIWTLVDNEVQNSHARRCHTKVARTYLGL